VDDKCATAWSRRNAARLAAAGSVLGSLGFAAMAGASPVYADTPAYELYCPGTPIGNIVLNDVVTTGTLSGSGSTYNLTNYTTKVTIPQNLVTASSAFGSTISGSATAGVTVTGATPATMSSGTIQFSSPIPTPLAAVTLQLPTPAGTLGPFTSTGGTVTVSTQPTSSLTLLVSGNPLSLSCKSYPNNTLPTESNATSPPPGNPTSQVIATSSGAATTPTTAPPTAPASSTLPQTGPGAGLYLVGGLAFLALLAGSLVLVLDRARRRLAPVDGDRRPRRGRPSN